MRKCEFLLKEDWCRHDYKGRCRLKLQTDDKGVLCLKATAWRALGTTVEKTPVAQASAILKPTHKSKQVNSSEGKTLLETSGGWAGLYLSQTRGSHFTLGLSFRLLFGTKAVTL